MMSITLCAQDADRDRRYDTFFLEAICQRLSGNQDAAFDLLNHCVEIDSMKPEAYFYLAQYYSALRQRDRALEYSIRAARLAPDNSTYLETLAEAYIRNQQLPEAIEALESLYERNRSREDVLGMLVDLFDQQHDYTNAIRTLERLEAINGKSERLSYAKANYYAKNGEPEAAVAEMRQLADQFPADLNYRALYGNMMLINGQEQEALEVYQDILRQEPNNRNVQLALMAYYQDRGDEARIDSMALHVLTNKNVSSEDRVKLMRMIIAEIVQQGGDSTRVLQYFRLALDQQPFDVDVASLCTAYMTLKEMPRDTIRTVFERIIEVQPDYAGARLQLVEYAWRDGDLQRIVDLCQAARQYNPDEMAFYYYQGIAYYQQGNLDEALGAFQNGIGVIDEDSDPEIVSDFYSIMGDLLHQKGQNAAAFAAYDSCLQIKPDHVGCLNNYAYYLSEMGQQLDRAEQMSYRTIKAEPKNATYLDTYAWILFMQKRYAEAKIYIDQTLQNDADSSAVMLEHAGDIYSRCGLTAEAVAYWQQALAKSSEGSEVKGERRRILIRKIKLKKYIKE